MYKVHHDNGKILGYYTGRLHGENIPEPNISISEEQHIVAINNSHNKVNNDGTTESFDFRSNNERKEQAIDDAEQLFDKLSNPKFLTINDKDYELKRIDIPRRKFKTKRGKIVTITQSQVDTFVSHLNTYLDSVADAFNADMDAIEADDFSLSNLRNLA